MNKFSLLIAGTVAAALFLPTDAAAQKVGQSQRAKSPVKLFEPIRKMTPAQRRAEQQKAEAKTPLLFKGKVFKREQASGVRLLQTGRRKVSPLALTPRVPLRAAASAASGRELWGSMVYDSNWDEYDCPYGMYKFNALSNITTDIVGATDNYANGGGAVVGDRLYFVYYASYGYMVEAYLYTYDTETWEMVDDPQQLDDFSLIASETAVAADGTVYGAFYNNEGTELELGVADYANMTRSTIGRLSNTYLALGITKDNTLYGVATDGQLYRIDTATAAETAVGPTGLTVSDSEGQYYFQSGEIDQKTDCFYWATVDVVDCAPSLYTIDLTTGAASKVGDFENQNLVSLLTIPSSVADGAPAAVTNLVGSFCNGSLSGTISFTMPTTTAIGDALTGAVDYAVTCGDETLASGTSTAGASVEKDVTFASEGSKTVTVSVSNAEGKGLPAKTSLYVGYDTPKPVDGLSCSVDNGTGVVAVSWDAVTEGVNNGYVGNVTYSVVRYPEGTTVATDIAQTTFTETLEKGALKSYSYGVTASNGKKTSDEAKTGSVIYGDPIVPPYSEDFAKPSSFDLLTVIDSNNDQSTWSWYGEEDTDNSELNLAAQYNYSAENDGDDWLITPPLKVEKGKFYTVSFKARSISPYFAERLEVKYGATNTAEAMTGEVLPATDVETDEYQSFSKDIVPAEDGEMCVGFHAISEKDRFTLLLDDIKVDEGKYYQAPDSVPDFSVTPADNGATSASIALTAPQKSIDGSIALSTMNVTLKRGGVAIKTFTGVSAGEKLTYVDSEAQDGFNTYTAIASTSEYGNGLESAAKTVFVGIDAPNPPDSLQTADNFTSVRISWQPSATGVNGGYVDPQGLQHHIYTIVDYDPQYAATTEKGATSYDLPYSTEEGEQDVVQFGVSSLNDKGESEMTLTPGILCGKPYSLPFFESFAGGSTSQMWWMNRNGGSSTYVSSSDASDNDGGSLLFNSKNDSDKAILGSGKISLAGATNPMLVFSHQSYAGSNAKINVYAQKPDGTRDLLKTVDYNSIADAEGWIREAVSLKQEYKSLKYIEIVFESSANKGATIGFDEIYVRNIYDNDVTLSDITAPLKMKKGETATVKAVVTNFGSNAANGYTVKLYADDELVDSKTETEALAPFESRTYTLEYKSSILSEASSVSLKAEADYASDMDTDNNSQSATVAFSKSTKPRPESVTAAETASGAVEVSWSAVNESMQTIIDGFEDCTSWATDNFGNWSGYTNYPNGVANGIFHRYTYPVEGQTFAFTVVEPLNNWLTEDALENYSALKPHEGNKYVASFYATDAETEEELGADNWLISPELSGNAQTVTFWVSNMNNSDVCFAETYDVLYSASGTDAADFVKIGDTHTASSGSWEQVSVDVPEGAKHFAIHQNTESGSAFVFMIDDVTFEGGTGVVTGYNVYRNGDLLKSISSADSIAFIDETVEGGKTYIYAVTAVYADGESEPTIATAIVTGIESVEAAIKADKYNVYTLDGKTVGVGLKNLKGLKTGSYIINGQTVVVR